MEVHGFGRSAGLIEDEVDALWSQVRTATNSLASHVPSSWPITLLMVQESIIGDPFFCLSMNHPYRLKRVIHTI
jgi:hypothetical protein